MSIQIEITTETETTLVEVAGAGPQGAQGPQGETGPGVPDGGAAGEILVKVSGDDQDTAWTDDYATSSQGALADTSIQPGDNVSALTNDANYIDADGAPVQSVNGESGDVVLDAADVGADPAGSANTVQSNLNTHINDDENPHDTTKAQVGLGDVPNLDTTDAVNKAHDQNTDTALDAGGANEVTAADARSHIDATDNPHGVTAEQVGLGNVDNTSDADKPVSTAQQEALDAKADDADISTVGKTGNYNDLLNKPDLSVLEEVLVFDSLSQFPNTGETGKVYIAEDTGFVYRWSGSEYIQLTDQTAIWGEIGGTLSNQTDLQNALDDKADDSDLTTHVDATTNVHGIADTSDLIVEGDARLTNERVPTDGSVTNDKVASDAAIEGSKLDSATQASLGLADTAVQPGDNVSSLTNDANYIDADGAPVQSVNGQTGDVDLDAGDVGAAVVEFYNTSIDTGDWTGSGPYIATKTVSGLLASDVPIVDLDLSGVSFSDIPDIVGEFGLVYRVEASDDDELTVYATSEPDEDFDLTIQVVR